MRSVRLGRQIELDGSGNLPVDRGAKKQALLLGNGAEDAFPIGLRLLPREWKDKPDDRAVFNILNKNCRKPVQVLRRICPVDNRDFHCALNWFYRCRSVPWKVLPFNVSR